MPFGVGPWRTPKGGGSGNGPLIPPSNGSWAVPGWFFDPQNISGVASDGNAGTTRGAPLVHYSELARRWGTIAPELQQTTTLTWMSSHTDNTDPLIWSPYMGNGAMPVILGDLLPAQLLGTQVMGALTQPKNRAAGTPNKGDFGASGVIGPKLFLKNTTHASNCWVYTQVEGGRWYTSQPLAPIVLPSFGPPAEVDTWANGDSVQIYQPVQVNLCELKPRILDWNGTLTSFMRVYNLTVFDAAAPVGGENNVLTINENVQFQECATQRKVLVLSSVQKTAFHENVDFQDSLGGTLNSGILIFGGLVRGSNASGATGYTLDGDVILGCTITAGQILALGRFMMDNQVGSTGSVLLNEGSAQPFGAIVAWGMGGPLNFQGSSRAKYAGTAVSCFGNLAAGQLQLNGQTTATAVDDTGDPTSLHAGRNLTAANLDAAVAAGGFTGATASTAMIPGGASLSSGGF